MKTLDERLQQVMDEMRWSRADLVRISKQSSSVVSQWLGKGSKPIKSIGKLEAAEAIAAASGFCALWIAKGIGPRRPAAFKPGADVAATAVAENPEKPYALGADARGLVEQLARALDSLSLAQLGAARDALLALASAPDSRRARDALVAALTPTENASSKRLMSAA